MNAKLRKILMILAVVLVAVGAQSCLDDDDNDYSRIYPNAIVTMKNIDGATWFQLDDSTLLYPVNLTPWICFNRFPSDNLSLLQVFKRKAMLVALRSAFFQFLQIG